MLAPHACWSCLANGGNHLALSSSMASMANTSSRTGVALVAVGTALGLALLGRAIRRSRSPTIVCHIECECGKIAGTVSAKKEDSIRINCYCGQCRQYAHWVAAQGNKEDQSIGYPHGMNCIVQVCKDAVHLDHGREHLQLAQHHLSSKDGIFMHRFYAKCCNVPMFNTVSFLGFVGIFRNRLSQEEAQFAGPVAMFPEQALDGQTDHPCESMINVPDFWWKLIRYIPYASLGPFDYEMEPKIWGDYEYEETKKDK